MKISKEMKLAITAIVAIIIIYIGAMFLKGLKFKSSNNTYFVEMNDVDGLSISAKVLANGVSVGSVLDIDFNPEKQNVKVKIELDEGVRIPKGSTATLTKAMLQAPQLKLILAPNQNGFIDVNGTIMGDSSEDILTAAGGLVPKVEDVMGKVDSLLENVNYILQNPAINNSLYHVQELTSNVENSTRGIPYIIDDFRNVSGNFKIVSDNLVNTSAGSTNLMSEARGAVENLKYSTVSISNICNEIEKNVPQLMSYLNSVGDNLANTTNQISQAEFNTLVNNLNTAVNDLNNLTNSLNQSLSNENSSLGKLLNNPDVYNQLDSTLQSATLLLQDLKNNPKRYVHFSLFGRK